MSLWTSKDAVSVTGGKTGSWEATGLSIDTRTLKEGDLFVALKGPNADGHDYVVQAFEKGAAAALVDYVPEGVKAEKCLVVKDTLKALEDLGQAGRQRTNAKIIAVTGSVGKTGTKDMLEAVFSAQCKTHASQKSYNNHWGVPLTLALMPPETEVGIFEIGMNHGGEIASLSKMVQPDIAIITTVEAVHIENFENGEEGVAAAKAEIFEGLSKEGKALLNYNNKWFSFLSEVAEENGGQVFAFGEATDIAALMEGQQITSNETLFQANILDKKIDVSLCISGKHHAMNALPILLSVELLGYDLEKAAKSLSEWRQREGRGKKEKILIKEGQSPVILLDEHYNASPVAMRAAFMAMERIEGRKIAVLGDMAELGENVIQYHKDLAPDLLKAGIDKLYAAGPNMKALYDEMPADKQAFHAETPPELVEALKADIQPGDVILIKGSRGGAEKPKMFCLVDAVKSLKHK